MSRRRPRGRGEHGTAARRHEGRRPPRGRRHEGSTGPDALGVRGRRAETGTVAVERLVFRPSEICGGEAAIVAGQGAVEILRRELVSDLLFQAPRVVGGSSGPAARGRSRDERQGTAEKNGREPDPAYELIWHWTPPQEIHPRAVFPPDQQTSSVSFVSSGTGVAPGRTARAEPSPFATVAA